MKLRIVTSTATRYHAEDPTDPRFYIYATLGSGLLRFEVVAKMPNGDRGTVSGKGLFAAMMAHFGSRINIVEGNWKRAGGMTTHLDQVNRATAAGLDLKDAAPLTWTGLRASEYGFDRVNIAAESPPGATGAYDFVRVQFSR